MNPRTTTRKTAPLALAGLLTLLLAGCPVDFGPGDKPLTKPRLIPFNSRVELLQYFQQQVMQRTNAMQRDMMGLGLFGGGASPEQGGDSAADTSAGDAYTTTNVQEAGVDESDVFKSDGTYFYIVTGQSLRIVKARPLDQLAEVGRLDLDVTPFEIYLNGSKLILLAQYYEHMGGWGDPRMLMEIWPPYYPASKLYVIEIDIHDKTAPVETRRVEIDGNLVSSRLTNSRLIAVLTVAPDLPGDISPLEVALLGVADFMPQVTTSAGTSELVRYSDCYHPEEPDGYFMTTVVTLDADDVERILHTAAVVGDAGTIYASTEALYITDDQWDADNDYRETLAIHKFAFDEDGAARYTASGMVPGRLLNQFSLGEYQGYLRVATHVTESRFWGWGPDMMAVATSQDIEPPSDYNAVYVLAEQDGELQTVGSIEGIAPNETLHAARFLGDHGFLVTFRKIDPLFTLDLTDPTNPQVVGELKVPGFSDYLHPVGDTHLIGIGKYTIPTEDGFDWFQGIQVSLFDVSDWSQPTVVQQITLGGRGSYAETDQTHKAFAFLEESGLLALPVHVYSETTGGEPWEFGQLEFAGVVVYQVDTASGFTELGRIEAVADQPASPWDYDYLSDWLRAAIINDNVYSISPLGVRGVNMADFASPLSVELAQ